MFAVLLLVVSEQIKKIITTIPKTKISFPNFRSSSSRTYDPDTLNSELSVLDGEIGYF